MNWVNDNFAWFLFSVQPLSCWFVNFLFYHWIWKKKYLYFRFAEEAKSLELSPISSVYCDAPNVNLSENMNYLPNLSLNAAKN